MPNRFLTIAEFDQLLSECLDRVIVKRIPDPLPRYDLVRHFDPIKWVTREEFKKLYPDSALPEKPANLQSACSAGALGPKTE